MKLSFKEGDWVDFNTWTSEFGVSGQSGINVSKANNVIVCVSRENGDGVPYKDRWYSHAQWDGVCFTGQGLEGDQTLTKSNKRLKQDKQAYFFRKKKGDSRYLYCGVFVLVEESRNPNPRPELQDDINRSRRNVWMFNMKYISGRYPEKLADAMKNFNLLFK